MPDESRPIDGPMVSDCPIRPHVWREFRTREGGTLELIAHVRPDDSAAQVAATLRQWLADTESAEASIFIFDVYVLVEIGFEETVTALLPLTGWADLLRRVAVNWIHPISVTLLSAGLLIAAAYSQMIGRSEQAAWLFEIVVLLALHGALRLIWLLSKLVRSVRLEDLENLTQTATVEQAIPRLTDTDLS